MKKHRKQFAGVAIPVFFLFLFGAMSLSVFPGWLKPSYGVPGAPCTPGPGIASSFSPDCDVCNGEVCVVPNDFAAQGVTGQCGVASFSGNTFVSFDFSSTASAPQCPNGFLAAAFHPFLDGTISSGETSLGYPGCWDQCVNSTITLSTMATTFSIVAPVCQPNPGFCPAISGGTEANDCRTGECTAISTPEPSVNPSGCDFEYVDVTVNEDCQLCTDAVEAGIPACGNGVCERDENEDCGSCAIDCLLPGFEGSCPVSSGQEIVESCNPAPSPSPAALPVALIAFNEGPPYNQVGSLACEDGDLCTDNACGPNNDTCEATEKTCDAATSDFCCPAGCDASTDVDCYVPQECVIPPPIGNPELSGNCIGTLVPGAQFTTAGAWGLLMLLALAAPALLKRR